MKNWDYTVTNILMEYAIYGLGIYGPYVFTALHDVIANLDPGLFGIVCSMLIAFILILLKNFK
ncbi:hypothetical protein [Gracilibacillus xinjiangensis]|uniref:AtpZ/AtpI family protein n=1 Tax=Gracilibacillus xinjiangensis TaxID=1193282 RepID=A0ABV8WU65_9BACI